MNNMEVIDEMSAMALPVLTEEELRALKNNSITALETKDMNQLLSDKALQEENGFTELPSGGWLVATSTFLPGITAEMVNWWFWWHAKDDKYYKVWYPGEHFATSVKEKELFEGEYPGHLPLPMTHYPVERIGNSKASKLHIHFIEPAKFGFNRKQLDESNMSTQICANVGAVGGLIKATRMVHLFRQEEGGLTIISRFWMGEEVPKPLRKIAVDENRAEAMAIHCKIEYTRLGQILPHMYKAYR